MTQLEWAQLEWAQLEWAQLPGEGGERRPHREGWNDESKAGIFPSHLALPAALPQRALPLWDACGNSQQHFSIPIFVLFDGAAGLLLQVKVLVSTSGFEPWDRLGSLCIPMSVNDTSEPPWSVRLHNLTPRYHF